MQKIKIFFKKYVISKPLVLISTIILTIILFTLGGSYLYIRHFLNSSPGQYETVDFTITKGESVRVICKELEEKGVISDDLPMLVYLKLSGQQANLKAGDYRLAKNLTPREVVDILTKGRVASKKITIPEGWKNEQIAEYLEKEQIVSKSEFLEATKKSYDYWFLRDLPPGRSLEGFLFPDTYQVSLNATSEEIIKKMLDNFEKKVSGDTKLLAENFSMSIYDIVNLASIVEKEVSKPEERKVVAGIFLRRLDMDMALESCATIQYYLGTNKKVLSSADLATVSPYNTYLTKGLPYGPIGNPGIDSIKAVLSPTRTDYLFFLSTDGVTYYAKTLDQHEANKAKYLQ
jgi:UPF0755 protein